MGHHELGSLYRAFVGLDKNIPWGGGTTNLKATIDAVLKTKERGKVWNQICYNLSLSKKRDNWSDFCLDVEVALIIYATFYHDDVMKTIVMDNRL